ncbi:MAG TPA: outer membrane lipoprotein-sorting protein, partial [Patescibacteria group bacterium]|nr:outer membrane lipoprotein-sorting protein [Patescibacteria group bacterium]
LVRFLGPKEKGKYLLRLDDVVWFLAPGSRKPVKVSAARRLRGSASLDEILGIRYARDYLIDKATETADAAGPLAVLDLSAKSRQAAYPRVRYVVRRATGRPLRAEYLLRSGKISSTVEFIEWEPGSRPVARKLLMTDNLFSNVRTEVTLLEMEERKVPDALFDLADPSARKRLEGP